MSNKIRYAIASFDGKNDYIAENTIEWREDYFNAALNRVKSIGNDKCAMFHYPDIKDDMGDRTFFAVEMDATREQFESDPAMYGVCYYKQPFSGGTWVFE